jgi:hypothetical protein
MKEWTMTNKEIGNKQQNEGNKGQKCKSEI